MSKPEEDKMTPNKEDYLKAIYKLGGMEELVNNKQIAETLQIAPASVTEMLGKLKREGLIHYEPYKGSCLTPEGIQVAISLVRGHRLWEVFLMRHLGYSWSEAHEDAELLEHITPPRLTARLDKFLNYPAYCPHGSAIPHPDGQIDHAPLLTLNLLPMGAASHIRRVKEEKELLDYLQENGITIGCSVRIIEAAAYEGPLTLDLEGKRVQISYKAACQIYVDEI
jgi:DtxR family Mn-dependent transcriptional regulator